MQELSEVSELITKFDNPEIVEGLLKELDVSPLVIRLIKYEALCETFGWTKEQLMATDLVWVDYFTAIIKGRQKAIAEKTKPNN